MKTTGPRSSEEEQQIVLDMESMEDKAEVDGADELDVKDKALLDEVYVTCNPGNGKMPGIVANSRE